MVTRRLLCAVGVSLVAVSGALAQAQKKKNKDKKTDDAAIEVAAVVEIVFGDDERRIIRDWFRDERNLEGLPPGLAKREELPPGLQKHLVKNGTLPPGLEKKLHPLPRDLESRLPRLPEGTRRVLLSGRVVLLGEATGRIFDILDGVLE
ncbi:MAG TPA: hypothetical protein VLK65_29980 [Vicinamibacteria bacterium]|nr:hypothetical protein [Vicinamibacteria bacterium]